MGLFQERQFEISPFNDPGPLTSKLCPSHEPHRLLKCKLECMGHIQCETVLAALSCTLVRLTIAYDPS